MICILQSSLTYKSSAASVASAENEPLDNSLDKKRKEMAKGPDLGDFISGAVPKGESWVEYKGNVMSLL